MIMAKDPYKRRRARIEAEAKLHPRCEPTDHDWAEGDTFSTASDVVSTWQCRTCLTTTFVYRDRSDPHDPT
jgi:hypothetical protein